MENCKGCKFSSDQQVYDLREEMYACKRFPPKIIADKRGEIVSQFPVVRANSWCGEYKY